MTWLHQTCDDGDGMGVPGVEARGVVHDSVLRAGCEARHSHFQSSLFIHLLLSLLLALEHMRLQ